ncbi:hypothetical protein GEW_12786 [Pasteurella multocida subsp. gallicida str. Anand1_poultry]|nr:hypothetical protein GEW_12786 [Pasteurella multocida subsp. gallicida str. Anand1_poultry]
MAYYPSPEKCLKIQKKSRNKELSITEQPRSEPSKKNYFVWLLVISILLYFIP